MQSKFQNLAVQSRRLVYFAGGPEGGSSERAPDGGSASKEIFGEVARMKRQLAGKETSDTLADTVEGDRDDKNVGTNFLKGDTTILISENSDKSKNDRDERHNKAGWKGLVLKDDTVRILDKRITKIDGKEYIKVRVRHNLVKGKNEALIRDGKEPLPDKYRIYEGYVEVLAFKTPLEQGSVKDEGDKKEVPKEAKENFEGEFGKLWGKAKEAKIGDKFAAKIKHFGQEIDVELERSEGTIIGFLKHEKEITRMEIDDEDFKQACGIFDGFSKRMGLAKLEKYKSTSEVAVSDAEMELSDDTMVKAIELIKEKQETSVAASIKQKVNYNGKKGELKLGRAVDEEAGQIIFVAEVKFEGSDKVYRAKYRPDTDWWGAVDRIGAKLNRGLEDLIEGRD